MAWRFWPPAPIPTADWGRSQQSEGDRYDIVMDDLQMIGRRNMLCGLHVHIELPDPDERVDVMMRMLPYLPLMIALATSSPFWRSRRTGLKGYRLAAYDELPRTGVPELLRTKEEFDAYVAALVKAGVMDNASYIWWSMRPSLAHPTLELRAPDCPTRVEDFIAIAALYRTLARHLVRNPVEDTPISTRSTAPSWSKTNGAPSAMASRARSSARTAPCRLPTFSKHAGSRSRRTPSRSTAWSEVERCRDIVSGGTSADTQLAVYEQPWPPTESRQRALQAVNDWLAEATLQMGQSSRAAAGRTPWAPGRGAASTMPSRAAPSASAPAPPRAKRPDRHRPPATAARQAPPESRRTAPARPVRILLRQMAAGDRRRDPRLDLRGEGAAIFAGAPLRSAVRPARPALPRPAAGAPAR